jgi:D-alanyl-D-alanine carboxypeptidase
MQKMKTNFSLLEKAKEQKVEIRNETKLMIQKALISSSNDDANSLGIIYDYSFHSDLLSDTNILLKEVGANDALLTNLTGLDNEDGTPSNLATPLNIAKAFSFFYNNHKDVFEYTKFDELDTDMGKIKNTNQSSDSTFGILASKTGFTYSAGGNLGVIVSPEPGSTFVIVIMGSSKEGRFLDMKKIIRKLPQIINNQ